MIYVTAVTLDMLKLTCVICVNILFSADPDHSR